MLSYCKSENLINHLILLVDKRMINHKISLLFFASGIADEIYFTDIHAKVAIID